MLLKTIKFDNTNPNWRNDWADNTWFLHAMELHLNTIIEHRGYIYLNQIYESLDVKWNPDDENPCIKNDGVDRPRRIEFEIFKEPKNVLTVHIYRHD